MPCLGIRKHTSSGERLFFLLEWPHKAQRPSPPQAFPFRRLGHPSLATIGTLLARPHLDNSLPAQ